MSKPTDVRPIAASLYFLPIHARVPLKFGPEITTEVTCARVKLTVRDRQGRTADGWGETPLSVQWVWPSSLSYSFRHGILCSLCQELVPAWASFDSWGHPIEIGHAFQIGPLANLAEARRSGAPGEGPGKSPGNGEAGGFPWLAALVCASPFDLALHDAYANLHGLAVYDTYTSHHMNRDLGQLLEPISESGVRFAGRFPDEFLVPRPPESLPAWHLVGGKDPIEPHELTGGEPSDDYPVLLRDWIRRDGLNCLKIKLTGTDAAWDMQRLIGVGSIAIDEGCEWLSADFNCTVSDPAYVNEILDRLMLDHPRIYQMILYVEQPFPYDLERNRIEVRSVAARKPLFMDESAHDWKLIRLGRALGWSGVALKTCKTQTEAILSLCWAKAHGMPLMVQDLSNPMLAQIPHVLLAAHAGTIMGVETNGMQFYPDASRPEAAVHPGLYRRRNGRLDLSSIHRAGFGYRIEEIGRALPPAAAQAGDVA